MSSAFLTAAQACEALGVQANTLYAYVSRGLIRSEALGGKSRLRRYSQADIEALSHKRAARRDPQGAVQEALGSALHWGEPVLESALTQLEGGKLSYRGHDAARLSESASVEEVAALLWTAEVGRWHTLPLQARLNLAGHPRAQTCSEALAYALTHAAAHDLTALDSRPEALPGQAARVLSLLYATLERHSGVPAAPDLALHARLARAWGAPHAQDPLRRALVLLADHELNVSTFAARVTASSGASLHHVTLSALCALQGPQHGLATLAAYELLSQAQREGAASALQAATRRYARPPGFGHRLYPQGDVRAAALLRALNAQFPQASAVMAATQLSELTRAATGEAPNVDLALATLTQVLGRGSDDTLALFALARAVGWLAHALETLRSGQLIRPRARYVGVSRQE